MRKPLRVIKFGGTSVGDDDCIANVVKIIRTASIDSNVVVIVSAMSGVTNKLIDAAEKAEAGSYSAAEAIINELFNRYVVVLQRLIRSAAERARIRRKWRCLCEECERICERAAVSRELTSEERDSISALGERLCAPILAAALTQWGVPSEAIEATEVVVTDNYHGAADPIMGLTRERCQARLLPLLQQGVVPVVTGFIGATEEGALTTLGRGGSDYSATILGAAVDADEVVIWTDVDGILTADPRHVPEACTIPEISYREATELAYFGAKVLHPKTLSPVMESAIPVWIRNTFAPEKPGTRIRSTPAPHSAAVKAVSAIGEAAVITLCGSAILTAQDVVARALTATAVVRGDVLLTFPSPAPNSICLAVRSTFANRTVEALGQEFAQELAGDNNARITVDATLAIVTVVGRKLRVCSDAIGRALAALDREDKKMIAVSQHPSEDIISFVVAQKDLAAVLRTTHRELRLGRPHVATDSIEGCFAADAA